MTHRAWPLARTSAALRGRLGRHRDRAALLLILLVGLALRLAFTFRAPVFVLHDSIAYFQSGYDFARGAGFELAFKRTPLYPLFVAGVVALVGEDLQALGFVQHLLGLLTSVLTYFLGRALFGRAAGLAAGLLVALSGSLIIYEHYVLAESLFILLLVAFALAFALAVARGQEPSPRRLPWLVAAGLLLGLAGLTRPVGQTILLAAGPALRLALGSWRRAVPAFAVVSVAFAAVTVPWMARNYAVNGSFEAAGALGMTLTDRIARHDEGFVLPSPDSPSPYADPVRTEARALMLRQMARDARSSALNHRLRENYGWSEAESNRFMRDICLEILASQKERYLVGTLAKIRKLLWGEPENFFGYHWASRKSAELREDWVSNTSIAHLLTPPSPLQEAEKYNAAAIAEFFSPYTYRSPLLALLLLGLVAGLRSPNRWATIFLALTVLSLVVPAAAFVGYVQRYRYPADPFMAVLIGGGMVWAIEQLVRAWRGVRRRHRMHSAVAHSEREPDSGEVEQRVARELAT